MDHGDRLREHLLDLRGGGHTHLNFDAVVAGQPSGLRGTRPLGLPQTPSWLLEQPRIAQWDIPRFCIDPHHVSPAFPEGCRPEGDGSPDPDAWECSVAALRADRRLRAGVAGFRFASLVELVADP
jgi:hypothetical protein